MIFIFITRTNEFKNIFIDNSEFTNDGFFVNINTGNVVLGPSAVFSKLNIH